METLVILMYVFDYLYLIQCFFFPLYEWLSSYIDNVGSVNLSGNVLPNIYLFKVNNRNTRRRCEICSALTIKTPEQHQWILMNQWININESLLLALNKGWEIFNRNKGKSGQEWERGAGRGLKWGDWKFLKSLYIVVLFGWMGDYATFDVLFYLIVKMELHMPSLGTLVPEGPWCVFYSTRRQVYWGLAHIVVFDLLIFFNITHRQTLKHTAYSGGQ